MSQIPTPPQEAVTANAEGMAAIRAGDAAAAIAAFTRATQADPGALALWRNLAHAYRLAGDDKLEGIALDRALDIDRLDFGTQLRKAQLLQRQNQEQAALQAWNNVRQLVDRQPQLAPQVEAEFAAGMAYCEALQARLGAAADGVLATGKGKWDETEQRRIKAFVDRALGRRAIYHNECAGLYYPFLPADEYFDRKHFPWLDELEAHTAEIRAELEGILADPGEAVRPYVRMEEGSPPSEWSTLDHSLDWGACFLWEYGIANQPVHERCPRTAALLDRLPLLRIPGRGPSAFFSILKPHSHIPPHTGVTNMRSIIHLPLVVPEGCWFRVGGETRLWREGEAFAFDDTIDHEAMNPTAERRAILIIDAWNPHISEPERQAICDYIVAADSTLR
jgi:aspartyl/asparaginyl beta-hydroxylase (cupin superfamily)